MAGIPQNFAALSNVLPTYNFVDIVAGTGIINFYAGNTVDLNLLSNFAYYSDLVCSAEGTVSGTTYTKALDLDFDVLLNRPLVLSGKTVVNIPVYARSPGNFTSYTYLIVKVRKWNGVTETEIAENTSSVSTHPTGDVKTYFMKAIDITIPLTTFKIGEYLRLTVEGWLKNEGAHSSYMSVGCDPKNRSTGWDTTGAVPSQLLFQVPVRLNL